jgi:hypothetical protein
VAKKPATSATKTVTLVRTGGSVWVVNIDETSVAFIGNGASMAVEPGEHTIQFFVRGVPGSTFSLEITGPPEAKLKFEHTFDNHGKEMGSGWFTIS